MCSPWSLEHCNMCISGILSKFVSSIGKLKNKENQWIIDSKHKICEQETKTRTKWGLLKKIEERGPTPLQKANSWHVKTLNCQTTINYNLAFSQVCDKSVKHHLQVPS